MTYFRAQRSPSRRRSPANRVSSIDPSEEVALSKLGEQYGTLYHTKDFIEGRAAEAEGRKPVYHGN